MELLEMTLSAPKEKVDVSVLFFQVESTLERLKRKNDPRAREVNLAQDSTVHSSSPGPRCCISSRHLSPSLPVRSPTRINVFRSIDLCILESGMYASFIGTKVHCTTQRHRGSPLLCCSQGFISRQRFQPRRISYQRTHSTAATTAAKPEPIAVDTSPVEYQAARQDAGRRRDVFFCARCLIRLFGVLVLANKRQRTDLQPHNCWKFQETLLKKRRGDEVWRSTL